MTIPSGPVAEQTASLLDLLASDERRQDDYDRFVAALRACVRDGWISTNDVREAMSNEHGLVVHPQTYSAYWRRARSEDLIRWYPRPEYWEVSTDRRGRNAGKPAKRHLATRKLLLGEAS